MEQIAIADFNHDGHLDVAFIRSSDNSVWLSRGDGHGVFLAPTAVYTPPAEAGVKPFLGVPFTDRRIVAGNFDGDRFADLLLGVTPCDGGFCGRTELTALYGTGTGFTAKTFQMSGAVRNFVPFDLNQDGRTDLTAANQCDVSDCTSSYGALIANAGRTFTLSLVPNPVAFSTGPFPAIDLNGDLRSDLVQEYVTFDPDASGVKFALAASSTTWNKQVLYPLSNSTSPDFSMRFVGNFTQNRKPDVVVYEGHEGHLFVLANTTSTGNFGACDYPRVGDGIRVCTPAAGSSKSSPVRFTASSTNYVPIRKMELWVDGKKLTEQFRSWLDFSSTLAPGSHRVTIFSTRFDDVARKVSFSFTVN